MSTRVPLAEPHLGGNEARYLQECVDTNFVSSVGPFVDRFEHDFAKTVGADHAVACSTGSAALHVALILAGAGPGTTVAVSSFTFIASVNAIVFAGATPLLVDSEPDSWNLDGERLHDHVVKAAANGRPLPAAIEVVHILGHPARMEPLLDLHPRFDIPLVEDAAEALGASWDEGPVASRQVGTVGLLGCFSFNGNKIITSGGGGMIVTADEELARRAKHLTTQAKQPGDVYVHDEIGFNYRMTNVAAALGVAQLEQLDDFVDRKCRIRRRYEDGFADCRDIEMGPAAPWARPSFWLSTILLADRGMRDRVSAALRDAGIVARSLWLPAHRQAPYAGTPCLGGERADELFARGLSLPSSVMLDEQDQQRVIDVARAAVGSEAV